jgi:hypothetical protein
MIEMSSYSNSWSSAARGHLMVNQFPIFMNQLLCSLAGGLIRMSQNLLGTNLLYQKDNKTGKKTLGANFYT